MMNNWEAGKGDYLRDLDSTNRAARKKRKREIIKRVFIAIVVIMLLSIALFLYLSPHSH